uniref:Uncharacterized protein n=1 Tax=Anguilla anguilla TaxID=7936 RepID=A0A0E9PSQ7_ANGAN
MTLGSEMMTSSLFQILLNKEKAPSWPNLQMSKLMVYLSLGKPLLSFVFY